MSGIHRRAAKRDQNEPEIVAALEQIGANVARISGEGIPDLLVGFKGAFYLLEVKAQGGRLKPAQITFIEKWEGYAVSVVWNVDDALRAIGAIEG